MRAMLILISVFFLWSCGAQNKKAGDKNAPIVPAEGEVAGELKESLDVTIIQSLVLAKQGIGLADEDVKILYSMDENADLKPVPLNVSSAASAIVGIYDTKIFIIFDLSYGSFVQDPVSGQSCTLVLLNKTSGKLHCVVDRLLDARKINPIKSNADGKMIVFEGWKGNHSGTSELYLIDATNDDELVIRTIYDVVGYPEQFAINSRGDVLVQYAPDSGRTLRIIKADGGFQQLGEGEYTSCLTAGSGDEENDFLLNLSNGAEAKIEHISKQNNGEYTRTNYHTSAESTVSNCSDATRDDNAVYMGAFFEGKANISIVKNKETAPVVVDLPEEFSRIKHIESSGEYVVVHGEDALKSGVIAAMKVSDRSITTLVAAGEYDIHKIFVRSQEKMSFFGERYSDSSKVHVTVMLATGEIQITSMKKQAVSALIPLN